MSTPCLRSRSSSLRFRLALRRMLHEDRCRQGNYACDIRLCLDVNSIIRNQQSVQQSTSVAKGQPDNLCRASNRFARFVLTLYSQTNDAGFMDILKNQRPIQYSMPNSRCSEGMSSRGENLLEPSLSCHPWRSAFFSRDSHYMSHYGL